MLFRSNDTATTEIYTTVHTLSLHDALPTSPSSSSLTVTGSPVSATVLAVDVASVESDSPTVFSLQVSTNDADEVAALAAANEASLIQIGSGAG